VDFGGHSTSSDRKIWTLSDGSGHCGNTMKAPESTPGDTKWGRTFTLVNLTVASMAIWSENCAGWESVVQRNTNRD
jgi:hypothetical protein